MQDFGREPREQGNPNPLFQDDVALGADAIVDDDIADAPNYRGTAGDPLFGFILAIAISIGLTPMLPDNADLRYTLAWSALAGVSVLAWLLGNSDRIEQEKPENVVWGVVFGILIGIPFLLFAGIDEGSILERASRLLFPNLNAGTVLAFIIFVMPLSETLFFRGLMQRFLDFWIIGILGGVWSLILFFPVMWGSLLDAPAVAIFLGVTLMSSNMMFAYVRLRNGLAASWLTQITTNIILIFIPFL